jgi:hypothetical protein
VRRSRRVENDLRDREIEFWSRVVADDGKIRTHTRAEIQPIISSCSLGRIDISLHPRATMRTISRNFGNAPSLMTTVYMIIAAIEHPAYQLTIAPRPDR